jgi:polysaccharide biosynthesis protein PslH
MNNNTLLVLTRWPFPSKRGADIRIVSIMKYLLSKECNLNIVCFFKNKQEFESIKVPELIKEAVIHPVYLTILDKVINVFKSILRGEALQVNLYYKNDLKGLISMLSSKSTLTVVHLVRLAYLHPHIISNYKLLELTDSMGVNFYSRINNNKNILINFLSNYIYRREARLISQYESDVINYFNSATVVSNRDKNYIVDISKKSGMNIHVIPLAFDSYSLDKKSTQNHKELRLGFIGKLGYLPNDQALKYIVENLLPLICKENFLVSLCVIGDIPKSYKYPINLTKINIEYTGWVDNMYDYLKDIDISLAPVFSGSGMQTKIVTSLSFGVPVIASSNLKDSHALDGDNGVLFFESPGSFLNILKKFKSDDFRMFQSEEAHKAFQSSYSFDLFSSRFDKLLEGVFHDYK